MAATKTKFIYDRYSSTGYLTLSVVSHDDEGDRLPEPYIRITNAMDDDTDLRLDRDEATRLATVLNTLAGVLG